MRSERFGGGYEAESCVKLNAVWNILSARKVSLTLHGQGAEVPLENHFQVFKNTAKNVLSGGKLFRPGFVAQL